MNKAGTVIIPADLNVWDHELKTAQALAAAGYTVEFYRQVTSTKQNHQISLWMA